MEKVAIALVLVLIIAAVGFSYVTGDESTGRKANGMVTLGSGDLQKRESYPLCYTQADSKAVSGAYPPKAEDCLKALQEERNVCPTGQKLQDGTICIATSTQCSKLVAGKPTAGYVCTCYPICK